VTYLLTEPDPTERESLGAYLARGGYRGLAEARTRGGRWVLEQVEQAGLRGRGGSGRGGLIAEKWQKVARATSVTRYLIANGAESSPVSQRDRYLMTWFPHRVLEGLLIGAVALGAEELWLYARGDSQESLDSLTLALQEAESAELLGGVSIQLQPSPAHYIAGEESAVIDSLEGLEGLPQPRPPHPEEAGLRGCPTAVQNLESLAAVAALFRHGRERFAAVGTPDCPGTALFTVSGAVARPGVYEVDYGTTLRTLLDLAGAPSADQLLAVLPGGLSSGPLRPDELEVPLTYEDLAAVGTSMGPSAVVVFAKANASLLAMVTETVDLLKEAACGQCRGCKEGHQELSKALHQGDLGMARDLATVLLYGKGNCAHPTGTARLALRALQAFPKERWE